MSDSSLSVVLPLYNGAAFVRRAITSVASQVDLPADWEIIVVDDGSHDGGADVCRQLMGRWPQIRLICHSTNRGVAAARNRGISSARYRYLGFLDQDDEWAGNKWKTQHEALQQSGADYVLGHQVFDIGDPDRLPDWFRASWLEAPQKGYVFGALLMRTCDFIEGGLLREDLVWSDDVDWFARAKKMRLHEHMLEDVVLIRHVHDRNASEKAAQSNSELLTVIRRHLSRQSRVAGTSTNVA